VARELYKEVKERRRGAALEMARGLSAAPVVVFHEGVEG
jgi:peptidoglycan/LPS O-acetylase OafA/YrhL